MGKEEKKTTDAETKEEEKSHTQKGSKADAMTFSFVSGRLSYEGFLFLFTYMIFPGLKLKLRGLMLRFVVDEEYILKIVL